jgi:nitrogen fixation protein NifB
VTGSIVTPEEAVKVVEKALELCPEITVIGIAGPGDTLASSFALDTFTLVHAKYPQLIKCLSTNGLELNNKAEQILKAGVTTVTITVNAIDPEVQSKICSTVVFQGQVLKGIPAAEHLVKAQLAGIRRITGMGLVVKINTVLVPGVNESQVEVVARITADAGASLINIIPLIPQHEFANYRAPDCDELNRAREAAGKYLDVFRHCQHCRADACGIPGSGKDLGSELYGHSQETFSHG